MLYYASVCAAPHGAAYTLLEGECTWCPRMVLVINIDPRVQFFNILRSARCKMLDTAALVTLVASEVGEAGLAGATLIRWPLRVFALQQDTIGKNAKGLLEIKEPLRCRI
jgi:hypothetical protein